MVKKGLNAGDFFQEDGNWYLIDDVLDNGHYKSHRISVKEKEKIEADKERKAAEEAKKAEKERKAAERAAEKAARKAAEGSGSGTSGEGSGTAERAEKDGKPESVGNKSTENDASGNDENPENSHESGE